MPTHGDYPWERDERRRRRERRRAPHGSVLAPMLIVGAIAAMLYGGFTIAQEPEPYPAPQHAAPPPPQPSVRDTVRGRLANKPRRASWPMRLKSRFAAPGVLEVWGSTPAPDGATITVSVRPSTGGRWRRLGDAPVSKGHFLVRQPVARSVRGVSLRIRARFG